MKKLLLLTAPLFLIIGACQKTKPTPEPIPSPTIRVDSEYRVGYEEATHQINFTIDNPIEEAIVSAVTESELIDNLYCGENEITFNISENDTREERTATIIIRYPEAEDRQVTIIQSFLPATDLSVEATANCYIVSEAGTYSFITVKGNSNESVGEAASAEVLWESFGTGIAPQKGDLIAEVSLKDGYIVFSTKKEFKKGNSVIAAKDSDGKILWSWHIWMTDKPQDQIYNNNAGTVMDRNLGATSTTPGDVCTLGLFYQWGRKDPFLGSSSISESLVASSTLEWPQIVESGIETGSIEYSISHPTTFIAENDYSCDWYYSEDHSSDDTRWGKVKTIYDPCPAGYQIPAGNDEDGIWSIGFGSSSFFIGAHHDETKGFDFGNPDENSRTLTAPSDFCWYPTAGSITGYDGKTFNVGINGNYWSYSTFGYGAYILYLNYGGRVNPTSISYFRAYGHSVRCCKEIH